MTRENAAYVGGLRLKERADCQADLDATHDDIERLHAVVENLTRFIQEAHGEDRRTYRIDVMRFESLLNHAQKLALVIKAKLDTL